MSSKPRWALVSFYCDQSVGSRFFIVGVFYRYGEHLLPPCGSYGELQSYDTLFSTAASEQLPLCSMTPFVSGHVTEILYLARPLEEIFHVIYTLIRREALLY